MELGHTRGGLAMDRVLFKACLSTCVFLFASFGHAILSCGQLLGVTAPRNQPGNQESGIRLSPAVAEAINKLTRTFPSAGVISLAELVPLFQSESRPPYGLKGYLVDSANLSGNQSIILITQVNYGYRGDQKFLKITYEQGGQSGKFERRFLLNGHGELPPTLHFVSTALVDQPFKAQVGEIPRSGVSYSNRNRRDGEILQSNIPREQQRQEILEDLHRNFYNFIAENPFLFSPVNVGQRGFRLSPDVGQIALLIAEVPSIKSGTSTLRIVSGRVTGKSVHGFTLMDALGIETVIDKMSVIPEYLFVQRSLPNPLISTERFVRFAKRMNTFGREYNGPEANSPYSSTRSYAFNSILESVKRATEELVESFGLKLVFNRDSRDVNPGDIIIPIRTEYFRSMNSGRVVPYIYATTSLYQVLKIEGVGTNDGYIEVIAKNYDVMRIPLRELNDGYYLVQAPETNP